MEPDKIIFNLTKAVSILSICLIMIVVGFVIGVTYRTVAEVRADKPPVRIIDGKFRVVRESMGEANREVPVSP